MSPSYPSTKGPEPHLARLQARVARGQSLEEAAEGLGIPLWLAKAVFVRSGLPVPRPVRRRVAPNATAQKEFEPTAALLALRLLSHELGAIAMARGPWYVTMAEWDRRRDPSQHPSAEALATRYGGWGEACRAAGVPARTASAPRNR